MLPHAASSALFILALVLPILVSWIITIVPTRRKEASGIVVGNPLHDAPVSSRDEMLPHPLVHLARTLDGNEMAGYVLGLRHMPVASGAPVLDRHIHGSDPALQLYAQGILQQGKDKLQHRFQLLLDAPANDTRKAAWLLETGLLLASGSLNSTSERESWLTRLSDLARTRLKAASPTPSLLAAAAQVFLQAGHIQEADAALKALPAGSVLQRKLSLQISHLVHQRRIAA